MAEYDWAKYLVAGRETALKREQFQQELELKDRQLAAEQANREAQMALMMAQLKETESYHKNTLELQYTTAGIDRANKVMSQFSKVEPKDMDPKYLKVFGARTYTNEELEKLYQVPSGQIPKGEYLETEFVRGIGQLKYADLQKKDEQRLLNAFNELVDQFNKAPQPQVRQQLLNPPSMMPAHQVTTVPRSQTAIEKAVPGADILFDEIRGVWDFAKKAVGLGPTPEAEWQPQYGEVEVGQSRVERVNRLAEIITRMKAINAQSGDKFRAAISPFVTDFTQETGKYLQSTGGLVPDNTLSPLATSLARNTLNEIQRVRSAQAWSQFNKDFALQRSMAGTDKDALKELRDKYQIEVAEMERMHGPDISVQNDPTLEGRTYPIR